MRNSQSDPVRRDELDGVRAAWESFGRNDPLFAVLTERDKRGGRWNAAEFFETGRTEIRTRLDEIEALGIAVERGRALDFGCGVGRLTEALGDHFSAVDGVDVSGPMVDRARSLSTHASTCTYHLNPEPDLALFQNGTFDFIYSSRVLQHTRRSMVRAYLVEMVRVLKPAGVILFQLPTTPRWSAGGVLVRLTPLRVLRRLHRMEMIGLPETEVLRLLEGEGLVVVSVVSDDAAGSWWNSRRYTAHKAAHR
ncbi:MAG: hypothetical protein NVSMB29_01730 [Candidatus Dormibacteria bacterium]